MLEDKIQDKIGYHYYLEKKKLVESNTLQKKAYVERHFVYFTQYILCHAYDITMITKWKTQVIHYKIQAADVKRRVDDTRI